MRAVSNSCRARLLPAALVALTLGHGVAAHGQEAVPAQADANDDLAPIDPDQDLAPLPDLEIDWPELDQDPPPLATLSDDAMASDAAARQAEADAARAANPGAAADLADSSDEIIDDVDLTLDTRQQEDEAFLGEAGVERPYSVRVVGIDDSESEGIAVNRRFGELSQLDARDGDPALVAQINRRSEADAELLYRLLKIDGFYDALVAFDFVPDITAQRVEVVFTVTPGERYPLSDVDLAGLDAAADGDSAKFRADFPLAIGDPADQDDVVAGREELSTALQENGYPFASVDDPALTIDHEAISGVLAMPVTPGGKRNFGKIVVEGGKPFDARHTQLIARFEPGDLYKASDIEDLRRAIIATSLVSQVTIDPVDSGDGKNVDVAVKMIPAPPRTIAGEIGYGTGEGFRAEVSWEHRNFFPPEGLVRVRAVAGTREQLGHIVYRRNNFLRRDQVLTAQALASNQQFDAYDARTALVSGVLERKTTLIFQKKWSWSLGGEIVYTAERPSPNAVNPPPRTTYYIAALPGSLYYDGSDDLLDPKTGFRLGGRLSPEFSLASNNVGYVRVQLDGSYYRPVNDKVVLAARVRLGTIAGAATTDIAPSRRNYAGGGGSVRGYGYQAIGPRDAFNDPIGGRGLIELSGEARIRLDMFGGNFGVVPFVDAGNVYDSQFPDFSGLRLGAGVGIRYYTNFGPIRVDVGTPLNPRQGDPRVAVYVSLGQAF